MGSDDKGSPVYCLFTQHHNYQLGHVIYIPINCENLNDYIFYLQNLKVICS